VQTPRVSGLRKALTTGWSRGGRAGEARSGKIVLDLAVAVAVAVAIALGGDRLADLAVVRAQPDLFGHVPSDPTVSRLIATLAADAAAALAALREARATARGRVWRLQPPAC
jgi:hypothetical protein